MTKNHMPRKRALKYLLDFLKIPGRSGEEKALALEIKKQLLKIGVPASYISFDAAHKRIPGDYSCGNLIVKLPGTLRGPRRVLIAHMDTVPLCQGATPVVRKSRIYPADRTGLGADNRTAVAALVTVVDVLFSKKLPHPPLTLLFTVGEEVGLWGAKKVSLRKLGNPTLGINIDSGNPDRIIIGAIGANRWSVEIHGRSAHAGVHPENGISAILIAAQAISEIKRKGYWGRVLKRHGQGTSNIGVIQGGEATNQVTDHVFIRGESRSHSMEFMEEITTVCLTAFENAAKKVKNDIGQTGHIKFISNQDYEPFALSENEAVVQFAYDTAQQMGLVPSLEIVNGGLDASALTPRGLPTVTIGAGQHNAHTLDEYVELEEYYEGCRLALSLSQRN